jgi:hypothetical protein
MLGTNHCGVESGGRLCKWCFGYPSTNPETCTAGIVWRGKVCLRFGHHRPCMNCILVFFGPRLSACPNPTDRITKQLPACIHAERDEFDPWARCFSGIAQHAQDTFLTMLAACKPLALVYSGLDWLPCLTCGSRHTGAAFFRVCCSILLRVGGPLVLLSRPALGVKWRC